MAPRSKTPPKILAPSPEEAAHEMALSKFVEEVNGALKKAVDTSTEVTFTVPAPIVTHVLQQDDSYKQKTVTPDAEMWLDNVRVGAKKVIIFTFKPMDTRPYKQVEFREAAAMETFPTLEAYMRMILGVDDNEDCATWVKLRHCLVKGYIAAVEEKQQAIVAEAAQTYEHNPNWGLF